MHADFSELLNAKKIATDEDARLKTLSIGATIPDIFMGKVRSGEDIYQFYPHSLFQETGREFTDIDWTREYQALVNNPNIRKKRVSARRILEDIAVTQGESGYPYLLFEGHANRANPIPNVGSIKMSNLCSEILQPTIPSYFHPYGQESRDQIGLDVSCNLASLVIEQTMNSGDIGRVVKAAIRMLDNVARSTSVSEVPAVKRANDEMRSVGLGAMGLHSFLAGKGLIYGSPEALDFVNVFFAAVHYHARKASMELARDTGFVFKGFEGSRYQSGEYFQQYLEHDFLPKTPEIATLFEKHTLPTRTDWEMLVRDIKTHGLAHSFVMAVAPTGSISYVSHASASIMPITERVETRTSNKARTIYPMPHLSEDTEWYYEEAYDMDMRRVLDTVAAAQRHVDQGISCTLFVPANITTRTLQSLYLYAYRLGIKTLYYTRLRKTNVQDCLSCVV
jgi:ribonucleoside-diphosphate reductase alpha chain